MYSKRLIDFSSLSKQTSRFISLSLKENFYPGVHFISLSPKDSF